MLEHGRSDLLEMLWLAKCGQLGSYWRARFGCDPPAEAWHVVLSTARIVGEPRSAAESLVMIADALTTALEG